MTEVQIFCYNVKVLRERRGLSIEEMAQILKISVFSVWEMERGVLPDEVTIETIFFIQKHFGISAKSLFEPI